MIAERLLLPFARPVDAVDLTEDVESRLAANPLSLLERECPDIREWVCGADVLDFGCGRGHQSIAFARAGARRVMGLDIVPEYVRGAALLAAEHGVSDRVSFATEPPEAGAFDLVVSQNSMEHYPDPVSVLDAMSRLVRPGGRLVITFGPPWLAPFGHHMHFFLPLPWLNLWCPESVVMRLRARYRDDGARRYEDVTGGLNRMTLRKFERLVRRLGWPVEYRRYTAIKRLPVVTHVPILRELATNHVTAVLRKP